MQNYVISTMTASKLIKKRCVAYLAYIIDFKKGRVELNNLLIVKEFSYMFLEELSKLPQERKVNSRSIYCQASLL
jgi:hypothetical protein